MSEVRGGLKSVTVKRDEVRTVSAEVKGELKAITAERDKLSASKESSALEHAKLAEKHRNLLRSHGELQANYKAQEAKVVGLRGQQSQ